MMDTKNLKTKTGYKSTENYFNIGTKLFGKMNLAE